MTPRSDAMLPGRDPAWPWEWPGAVFRPASDLIEREWLEGLWVQAVEHRSPDGRQDRTVERSFDTEGRLIEVIWLDADWSLRREVRLALDEVGRLTVLEDRAAGRRFRLDYEYRSDGSLERETELHETARGGVRVLTADHQPAPPGELRCIEVREGSGRLIEDRYLSPGHGVVKLRSYDACGYVWRAEDASYREDGRLAKHVCHHCRFDQHEERQLVESRMTETCTYDAASGWLVERILVQERNVATDDGPEWRMVTHEMVTYHRSAGERPVRDVTRFFDLRETREDREHFRLVIEFFYDEDDLLVEKVVTEEDLPAGRVRRRRIQFRHGEPDAADEGPLEPIGLAVGPLAM